MLSLDVDAYLGLRRGLGFSLQEHERYLRNFTEFSKAQGEMQFIRAQLVASWAEKSASPRGRHRRLRSVYALARHLRAEDVRHELPPAGLFRFRRQRRVPHIFAASELHDLLAAALELGPRGSLRPIVFHTLFGLLACSGLRISEALRLRVEHLTEDGLFIEKTKFKKDRLVPLHVTSQRALQRYLLRRRRAQVHTDRLFVSQRGYPLRYDKTVRVFLELIRRLGLRGAPGTPGPHIHDLRHTFAVRALEAAPGDEKGVGRHIVALSTYLGHAHVSDTYWYLHATPTLMRKMGDAAGQLLFGGVP